MKKYFAGKHIAACYLSNPGSNQTLFHVCHTYPTFWAKFYDLLYWRLFVDRYIYLHHYHNYPSVQKYYQLHQLKLDLLNEICEIRTDINRVCYRETILKRTRSYLNGNDKLMATENVIFFYASYGILTEKRNSYVFLKRNTEIRIPMNGITET